MRLLAQVRWLRMFSGLWLIIAGLTTNYGAHAVNYSAPSERYALDGAGFENYFKHMAASTGRAKQPSAYTPEPPISETNPALSKFYHQKIRWKSNCITIRVSIAGQCGQLLVPVDYEQPDGSVATLFLYRIPARKMRYASVIINPGGPGAAGTDYVLERSNDWAHSALTEHLDVVGFDPRGTGMSEPLVKCLTDKERDADRAQIDPNQSISPQRFTDLCFAHTPAQFLQHVGRVDVARDMDVLRSALGDSRLTFVGKSYGSLLAASYLEQFPRKVRALVFDGVVDPSITPNINRIEQLEGFENAMDQYATYCARTVTDCPLGRSTNHNVLVSNFNHLILPLIDNKIPTADGRGLTFSDASTAVETAMYSPTLWTDLTAALKQLKTGRGDILLQLADLYFQRDQHGHYSNLQDAFEAINCVDGPPASPDDPCNFWPIGYTSVPHDLHVPGAPRTIVVSTTGDPATPYQEGVSLAKHIGAKLITVHGNQHTATLEGNSCIDGPVINYLITGKTSAGDITCQVNRR